MEHPYKWMGLLETLSDWTSDVCTDDSVRCHRHHLAHTDGCMVVRSLQDCCCHRWRRVRTARPHLAAPTWRGHRIGRYEWTSGRSEDTTGCVAASAVYLPLDLVKMACDDLDGYRSRSRPAAQEKTDELTKRVLKGKIYAAWQNTPDSVSRPHLR